MQCGGDGGGTGSSYAILVVVVVMVMAAVAVVRKHGSDDGGSRHTGFSQVFLPVKGRGLQTPNLRRI